MGDSLPKACSIRTQGNARDLQLMINLLQPNSSYQSTVRKLDAHAKAGGWNVARAFSSKGEHWCLAGAVSASDVLIDGNRLRDQPESRQDGVFIVASLSTVVRKKELWPGSRPLLRGICLPLKKSRDILVKSSEVINRSREYLQGDDFLTGPDLKGKVHKRILNCLFDPNQRGNLSCQSCGSKITGNTYEEKVDIHDFSYRNSKGDNNDL